jgi:hypothetical protein
MRNIKNVVCRYVAKMERTVSTIRSPINKFSSARDKRKEELNLCVSTCLMITREPNYYDDVYKSGACKFKP